MGLRTVDVSVQSAKAAGLRYTTDTKPGIRRVRTGKGFKYIGPDGRMVRAADELARIRSLVIPPAWVDVWICLDPRGHLQATGRDARGRKQYRYHPEWRAVRDAHKFDRMLVFARALPQIRTRLDADIRRMQDVAAATGGRHFHAPTAQDLVRIFKEIASTLPVLLTE